MAANDLPPVRTKIVATIGPASRAPAVLRRLVDAGVSVFRLNFSHGTHDEHLARLEAVRDAERILGRPIAVLADLCGPKIRIATTHEAREVRDGDIVVFAAAGRGVVGDIEVTFPELASAAEPEHPLLIEDGRIRTRVIDLDGERVRCLVEVGGTIKPGKGVNLPKSTLPIPSLTDKDRLDLNFALSCGVDLVALSFVRTRGDVEELRRLIDAAGSPARIVAKVEMAEAVANLEAIVDASDVVMVARGDLGVEIGVNEVPLVQKRMIEMARAAGKTVITATQMLESMIDAAEPTRAEASDVANAILDGTSAVMLSAETAAGRYPYRAVEVMDTIARTVEPALVLDATVPDDATITQLLTKDACALADRIGAAAIVVQTTSGQTARELSRWRPREPIVAATASPVTQRQLALDWGVMPVLVSDAPTIDEAWTLILGRLVDDGLASSGDVVVMTGNATLPVGGTTSDVVIHRLA
jgi:pyruvate kinase